MLSDIDDLYKYRITNSLHRIEEGLPELLPFVVDLHHKLYGEKFIVKPFHEEMAELLTKCARRELDVYVIIFNLPARYSKTQFMIYYVIWCFLHNEMARFIYSTYSHRLTMKISREIKKGYTLHGNKSSLSRDSAELWETPRGGGFWGTTMGGSVTGFGAGDLYATPYSGDLIIDDPIKPSDAYFSTYRNNLIENFSNTFWSRRNNHDRIPIIVIGHRVHSDDLCGWLMNESGYPYQKCIVKALDDDGNATFPERVSKKTLLELKAAAPHTFAAQQQQDPKSFAGHFFQRHWFERLDTLPTGWTHAVRYWDRAATKPHAGNKDPDWTRGLKMLRYPNGLWIVVDLKSIRDTPLSVEQLVKNTASQDGFKVTIVGEQDPGSAGVSDAGNFTRMLGGFIVKLRKPTKDKATRARAVAAQCEAGNVKILKGTWNEDFLEELENFPDGKHDDIVDVLSGAFNELSGNRSILDVL